MSSKKAFLDKTDDSSVRHSSHLVSSKDSGKFAELIQLREAHKYVGSHLNTPPEHSIP